MKKLLAIFVLTLLMQAMLAQSLVAVQQDGKYGYKYAGHEDDIAFIIPPRYDDASYFQEGLAPVRIGDKWGYIDENGTMKIPLKYSTAGIFEDGIAVVSIEVKEGASTYDKCGFINKAGVVVIPLKFYNASGFNEAGLSYVAVKDGKGNIKWGFINKTGALVIPAKYDSLGNGSNNGYITVYVNGKAGFVNKKGVEVIAPKYGFERGLGVNVFNEGYAVVILNGKKGIIDENGKVIIPFKYDYMDSFREDLALVELNKKYGYVNKSGEEVISLQYTQAGFFDNGQALVTLDNGEKWTIDKTGKELKLQFKPEVMDSTVFTITYNRKTPNISLDYTCQSNSLMVIISAEGKAHKFPGESGIIDLSRLGFQDGDDVTVMVHNRKGCTVKMNNIGAGRGAGRGNSKGGVKTIKLFGH